MGDFLVYHRDVQTGIVTGQYVPENLTFGIRNSEPGEISYEVPLSEPFLRREEFGPYRTDYQLYRRGGSGQYSLITEGMLTSVNLNGDRDSVLLAGKDWIHYLERRVYPFNPVLYRNGGWVDWPKQWPNINPDTMLVDDADPVEVRDIVEGILEAMNESRLPSLPQVPADTFARGQLGIIFNNKATGSLTKYKIFPGDSTTIYDHIKKLSEMTDGFEFDIIPQSLEFKMWSPDRLGDQPVYRFKGVGTELTGQVVEADWTNDGPEGTVLLGLGTADRKAGAQWHYRPSVDLYRWLDKVYDFGELSFTEKLISGEISAEDMLLRMLKDQDDLFPQRKLAISLLNPEFLSPSFYTAGRPRALIGKRIHFYHEWSPYWIVDSDYRVNAINWSVDQNGNEEVELELEIIYEET